MNKSKIKVAINGLGRIGRAFLKMALGRDELEVVAINDLADIENLAYLIRYDSAYGRSGLSVNTDGDKLDINDREIVYIKEKEPANLPWLKLDIDVVLESTGLFASPEKAKVHLAAGAKKVVVSAPFEGHHENGGNGGDTILMGINEENLKSCNISSNASCTTNAASPVIQIMHEELGIEKALLSTVHAYTSSQRLVDAPDVKDWRRGRAGSANIIPSTTGAAIAVTKAIPVLRGLFDGIAMRVPIITGSLVDLTFLAKRKTSVEEVNKILREAAESARWKDLLEVTDDPLVSTDIIGNRHASIVDAGFTKVVGGDLVKILAWYDNEMGYTATLIEHVIKAGQNV